MGSQVQRSRGMSVIAVIIYAVIAACLFATSSTVLLSAFDTSTPSTIDGGNAFRQRDILSHRVFEGRGQTGLVFLDPMTGAFRDPTANPADLQALTAYALDVGLPAVIGVALGLICLIVACFIWYARCCCNCCCKGDPDPESKHVPMRVVVAILSAVAFCGAIVGLVGGVIMSQAIRDFLTQAIAQGNVLQTNMNIVVNTGAQFGVQQAEIDTMASIINQVNTLLRQINLIVTPFDVARMFVLYVGMALAMLAGITLGIGVVLRRKQITSTGYVCSAIALVVAWFIFGVNFPMSILFDDACITAEQLLAASTMGNSQVSFLLQCTDTQTTSDAVEQIVTFAGLLYQSMANDASTINGQSGMQTYSATVVGWNQNTVRNAGSQMGMFWTRADAIDIASQVRSDYLLIEPMWQACQAQGAACHGGNAAHNNLDTNIQRLLLMADGLDAVNVLIDCSRVSDLLNLFRSTLCRTLIVGMLLIFAGAAVVGLPLIPAVLLALYVGQMFPNRAAAAKLKSRLMVIFSFAFFNAIVSLVGELNTTAAEIALCAVTILIGAAGFAFLNIPMNRLNWSPTAQMALAGILAVMCLGIGGGWIWYLLQQASATETCISVVFQQSLQMGMFVLPTQSGNSPCWNNTYLAHTFLSTILAAVNTMMCVLGAVTAIILLIKIKCGYSLNLADSDFELD